MSLVCGGRGDPAWECVNSGALDRGGMSAIATGCGMKGHTHVPVAFTMVGGAVQLLVVAGPAIAHAKWSTVPMLGWAAIA